MKKKIVSICLVIAILAVAVVGGSYAYFTDYDGAENTFVFGNISIDQIELERIEQSDANTDATNFKTFTQDKELFPVVADPVYAANNQKWPEGGSGQLFSDVMGNVQDKIVFVKNDGKNDVYFRTLIAIEQGDLAYADWDHKVVGKVVNGTHYAETFIASDVEIKGNKYVVFEYVYRRDNNDGKGAGVLSTGATSRPSLQQVFLYKATTQEQVALLDGNDDGKLNVLVVSQAVQTAGFSDAATALDEAFGDLDAASAAAYLAEYKA